jgi:hypothetical protein
MPISNKRGHPSAKSLKSGFCYHCYFVRVRVGNTPPHTRASWKEGIDTHNNKDIYIIYIIGLGGSCVAALGFVWMAPLP